MSPADARHSDLILHPCRYRDTIRYGYPVAVMAARRG